MVSRLSIRVRVAATLAVAATVAFAGLLAGHASKAPADFRDNITCKGHIEPGDPDPDDATTFGVKYRFACSGPITGYSIATAPERRIEGLETEVFVTEKDGQTVIPTDSFSCNGEVPGYGINCVGTYGAYQRVVPGAFYVDRELCAERRLDPLLTVAYASLDSKGKPVQAMAGPFDLGRPYGCKAPTKFSGKTKIPTSTDTVLTGQEG